MLKTLLKDWDELAPGEVSFDYEDTCLRLNKNTKMYGLCSIDTSSDLLPYEQDTLQGYLQRCIENRGWAYKVGFDGEHYAVVHDLSDLITADSAVEALLTAYLTTLGAQMNALSLEEESDAKPKP